MLSCDSISTSTWQGARVVPFRGVDRTSMEDIDGKGDTELSDVDLILSSIEFSVEYFGHCQSVGIHLAFCFWASLFMRCLGGTRSRTQS